MTTRRTFLGILGGLAAAFATRRPMPKELPPPAAPSPLPKTEIFEQNGRTWAVVISSCATSGMVDVKIVGYR